MRTMKTLWPLGAAALALGLSGCGGGSNTRPDTTAAATPPAVRTPPIETIDEQLEAAKASLNEAEVELEAVLADGNSTQDEVEAARMKVVQAALQVSSLEQKIAKRDADAADIAPLALDDGNFQSAIRVANGDVTDETAVPYTTYFSVAEGGKPGAPATPNADDLLGGEEFAKTTRVAPQFANFPKWAGSVYERSAQTEGKGTPDPKDDITMSDMVTVYTNMEEPYYDEHFYSVFYGVADRPGVAGAAAAGGVLSLLDTARSADIDIETVDDLVNAADFPSANDQTYTWSGTSGRDLPTATDGIDGTFNGVPGTFWCDSTSCSATTDMDGKLSLSANWKFTPDAPVADLATLKVREKKNDADFVTFGYWLRTTTSKDPDVKPTYIVDAFQTGMGPTESVAAVVGSAKYAGPAGGLFVKRGTVSVGEGDLMSSGRFTARADLMANFGGNDLVPTDDQFSISGTISNFMHDGQMIDEEWEVELKKISAANYSQADGTFTGGETNGGGWSGRFYGPLSATPDAMDLGTRMAPPGSVGGTFDASFNNGEVIGAFGATKQ